MMFIATNGKFVGYDVKDNRDHEETILTLQQLYCLLQSMSLGVATTALRPHRILEICLEGIYTARLTK